MSRRMRLCTGKSRSTTRNRYTILTRTTRFNRFHSPTCLSHQPKIRILLRTIDYRNGPRLSHLLPTVCKTRKSLQVHAIVLRTPDRRSAPKPRLRCRKEQTKCYLASVFMTTRYPTSCLALAANQIETQWARGSS